MKIAWSWQTVVSSWFKPVNIVQGSAGQVTPADNKNCPPRTPAVGPKTHRVGPERPRGERLQDRRLPGVDRGAGQLHDRGGQPLLVGAVEVQPIVAVGPEGVENVEPPQSVSQPFHVVVRELLSAGPEVRFYQMGYGGEGVRVIGTSFAIVLQFPVGKGKFAGNRHQDKYFLVPAVGRFWAVSGWETRQRLRKAVDTYQLNVSVA